MSIKLSPTCHPLDHLLLGLLNPLLSGLMEAHLPSTISVYKFVSKGKLYQEQPANSPYFFCWLGLLFQMPIVGIRLDDMPAERIAYVWVDAHLLQAPFCGANLCFLLAFCEWSGWQRVKTRPEANYFIGYMGGDLQDGEAFQEERARKQDPHTHPPGYFSTWDQKPFPPLLHLQKAPAPGVMAQL